MIQFFEKRGALSLIAVISLLIIIFYFSSLSSTQAPSSGPNFSLIYHFIIFFWLAFFLLVFVSRGRFNADLLALAILFSLLYAASDEFHQFFVPGRSCAFSDVLTDSAGIFLAFFIYLVRLGKKKEKLEEIEPSEMHALWHEKYF